MKTENKRANISIPWCRHLKTLFTLALCGLSSIGIAQSRMTYGLQVGVGSTMLENGSSYASVAAAQTSGYYAQINSKANGSASTIQAGGYLRYYFASAFFVQSGMNYSNSGGTVRFSAESLLPENELDHPEWRPGYHTDFFTVRHRYHQLEIPWLVGVRFAKQLRLYVGPTVGVSLHTSSRVNTASEYRLSNDPVFRNLRVGIGADMQRLSLDIHLQETFPNTNSSSFEVSKSLPDYFWGESVSAGYSNVALRSVVITVGYRWH